MIRILLQGFINMVTATRAFNKQLKAIGTIPVDYTTVLNYYSFAWRYPNKRHHEVF